MSKLGWLARIGGYAAAPWTGGASIGIGNLGASAIEARQSANDTPAGPNTKVKTPEDGDQFTNLLQRQSEDLRGTGRNLLGQGTETIGPLIEYLKNIMSGNASGVMEATKAPRGRVMDQYDTARKSIAEFGPRGGGSQAAFSESFISEGNALSDITSNEQQQARQIAAQIGPQLAAMGLSAEQLASMDLSEIIRTILTREGFDVQKRGQNMEAWAGIGEAAGTIIADQWGRGK